MEEGEYKQVDPRHTYNGVFTVTGRRKSEVFQNQKT